MILTEVSTLGLDLTMLQTQPLMDTTPPEDITVGSTQAPDHSKPQTTPHHMDTTQPGVTMMDSIQATLHLEMVEEDLTLECLSLGLHPPWWV